MFSHSSKRHRFLIIDDTQTHWKTLQDKFFFCCFFVFAFFTSAEKIGTQTSGLMADEAPAWRRRGVAQFFFDTLKKTKKNPKHCTNLQVKESADAPWGVISSPLENEVYTALMHVLLHIHRPGTKFMLCYIIKKKNNKKLKIPPRPYTKNTFAGHLAREREKRKEKSPLIFFHLYF